MIGIGQLPPGSTPLPWRQLGILMVVRLSEPVCYSMIFPFINAMIVEETNISPEGVGFYSGLVESTFALVQFLCVFQWGSLSDRIGRRPVILAGVAGVGFSGVTFGFAKSLWQMLFFRALAGCLSGNVAVVKASLGEITDETNQAVAFPLYGLTWIIGTILGNALGGYASHPVENYPSWFGGSAFLTKYPYFLPCAASGALSAFGWIFAFFFLEESLVKSGSSGCASIRADDDEDAEAVELLDSPSSPASLYPTGTRYLPFRAHRRNASSIWNASSFTRAASGGRAANAAADEWPAGRLLRLPLVKRVVTSCFSLNLVQGAWTAVYLLTCYSPIEDGGLGLVPSQIGLTLACTGVWSLLFQLLCLPPLQLWLGVKRLYQLLCLGYVALFVLLPTLSWLAVVTGSTANASGASLSATVWAALYLALFLSVPILSTGSIIMILVNASAPHKSALGKINGLTTMAGSLSRAIGPSAASALFALSHSTSSGSDSAKGGGRKLLGGHFWWVGMVVISVVNIGLSTMLGDAGGPPKATLETVDEGDEESALGAEDEDSVSAAVKEGRARLKVEHEGEMLAHHRR